MIESHIYKFRTFIIQTVITQYVLPDFGLFIYFSIYFDFHNMNICTKKKITERIIPIKFKIILGLSLLGANLLGK